jgi:hypothetical protein
MASTGVNTPGTILPSARAVPDVPYRDRSCGWNPRLTETSAVGLSRSSSIYSSMGKITTDVRQLK